MIGVAALPSKLGTGRAKEPQFPGRFASDDLPFKKMGDGCR